MAQQDLNYGTTPGDGTGENLYLTFDKVQDNFDELYQKWVDLADTASGNGAADVGFYDQFSIFAGGNVQAVMMEVMRYSGAAEFNNAGTNFVYPYWTDQNATYSGGRADYVTTVLGSITYTMTYGYDPVTGQLITLTVTNSFDANIDTQTITYDSNGIITDITDWVRTT